MKNTLHVDTKKILEIMQDKAITIEDLADIMKKTTTGINYILAKRKTKFDTLNELADALDVDALKLLTS